jgi:exosome complex RNA-binding protein Rrp4
MNPTHILCSVCWLIRVLALVAVGMPLVGFSQIGLPLWTNLYNGPGIDSLHNPGCANDSAIDLAIGSNGNVYVTGNATGTNGYFDHATIAYMSGGLPLWTNIYNSPGNMDDQVFCIAVGGNGTVYVTGSSGGTNGSDYATIAYSSEGVALWTNFYNGPGNRGDYATSLAVGSNGNVYVTGNTTGTNGYSYYATIAYSSGGLPLWTNIYNGRGNRDDYATSLAVGSNGNVYVTGNTTGTNGYSDYATIAYSSGGLPLWTNIYNGPGNRGDYAISLAVGSNGVVYVTGNATGTNGSSNYATIAYSSEGLPLWTNFYNGPGNMYDQVFCIAVGGNGNVYVAGNSDGTNYSDYATIAYTSEGVALWTNRYNGPRNIADLAFSLAVGGNGTVYVTGSSRGTNGFDSATIAYTSEGVALWTNRYNGPGNDDDTTRSIAVGSNGVVYVTGNATGANRYSDYATVCYVDLSRGTPIIPWLQFPAPMTAA